MQKARISIVLPILIVIAMAGVCLASMHTQNAAGGATTRKNTTTVRVLFGLDAPESGIFPSDVFTIADDAQKTGLRVELPLPDCSVHVSDCRDLALINVLDGFSLQPRVTMPFNGDIDPSTVNSHNAFFVELGDADIDASTSHNETAAPLAGAQDKVAERIESEEVSLALGGAPSTHILKPAVERFGGVVSNEALCMTLAAHLNLPAAKVETRRVEDVEYLLVERYDRKHVTVDGALTVERLHQEDFCQAQNIVSEMKYQKEGGPSFKQCFALLRNVSTAPVLDLANLLDAAILNYLVGNNDAHGKNFSLVYQDKQIRLAPLYDVISTIYYPELSTDMAMKIGREYSSEKVAPKDFEQLAEEGGLAKPLVRRRVPELATAVLEACAKIKPPDKVSEEVAALIRGRCERARAEFRD